MLYSLRFFLQNAVCFIMLTCLVPVLFTFYIQGVLKLKKIIPASKGYYRYVSNTSEWRTLKTKTIKKKLYISRSCCTSNFCPHFFGGGVGAVKDGDDSELFDLPLDFTVSTTF